MSELTKIANDIGHLQAQFIIESPKFQKLLTECKSLALSGVRESQTYKHEEFADLAVLPGWHKALATNGLMWIEPYEPEHYINEIRQPRPDTFTFSW